MFLGANLVWRETLFFCFPARFTGNFKSRNNKEVIDAGHPKHKTVGGVSGKPE